MKRLALALLLSLSTSCVTVSSVLARSSSAPVVGACTVLETGHDRPDPARTPPRQSRWVFDARGRIVEHEYSPEYHSRALVRFRRSASGLLAAIDYRYVRQAESFPCGSVNGCDMPAVNVRGRVEFEYEGDRLVRRVAAQEPSTVTIDTFAYDARGMLVEHRAPTGVERFEYDGPHLRRREWNFSHGRGDELFVYRDGRLASVGRQMCDSVCSPRVERRLRYTSRGLLERAEHPEGSVETWSYDEGGRLVARGDGQVTREWIRYDSEGRVIASGVSEPPLREYRYEGACSAPSAIAVMNASIVGDANANGVVEGERRWWPSFP
ncbi:MAG: hypothetical protein JNK05_13715 [Myxococcales bacterium]|nr:hypothetical protein [Myxococcales bacterium]